jgi:signal transduction histidine kinase
MGGLLVFGSLAVLATGVWSAGFYSRSERLTQFWRSGFIACACIQGAGWALLAEEIASVLFVGSMHIAQMMTVALALLAIATSLPLRAAVHGLIWPIFCGQVLNVLMGADAINGVSSVFSLMMMAFTLFACDRLALMMNARHSDRMEKDALIHALEEAKLHSDEARKRAEDLNLTKSRFLATVSHELRTPLFNIKSFIETLHEYGDELSEDQKKEFLGTANNETDRLTRLVNDVLDLSRLESGRQYHFTAIDLSETIEQTVRTYKLNASSKGVELLHEISPNLERIWGNYDLILQVLYNLVGNALKFTETGGKVTIRIYPWQDQTTTQPHRVVNYVRVEVEDTGYGIPAEDCDRIFDRFYRVEDKVHTLEGTGLGLSIVRNIIEKHHSEIHLKSEVGVGSTFWFDLSVYQDRCELPVVNAIAAPVQAMSV